MDAIFCESVASRACVRKRMSRRPLSVNSIYARSSQIWTVCRRFGSPFGTSRAKYEMRNDLF